MNGTKEPHKHVFLPAATHKQLRELQSKLLKRDGQPLALTELIARLVSEELDRLDMAEVQM
jgi:hypothetical protein